MEIGFFTMPIHPVGKDWRTSLQEDREAFLLADELGFNEGYVGEHVTDASENITSSAMFIAYLAKEIKNLRMGTGTVNLPNVHPAHVAGQIAMLDHMLEGNFNFGISPGGLASDAEVFESLDNDRNEMFLESINSILKIWESDTPYDIVGKYWNISTARTTLIEIGQGIMAKPFQKPHPPIIVTAVAPFSKGVTEAAARGWDPISANFLMPQWVKSHWPKYVEGCERVGRPVDTANWRVAKSVFVCDDIDKARDYATAPNSPYRFYYSQLLTKMREHNRLDLFKSHREQPDDEVNLDDICDRLIIWGTPEKVAEDLIAFKEEVGEFGTLLYAGKDWADPELARRSMILMMEKVKPKIDAHMS